jgi:hypothetical protein
MLMTAATQALADENTAKKASPCVSISLPLWSAIPERMQA